MLTKFELKINPLTVVLLIGFVVCLVVIFKSCNQDLGAEIGRLKGEIEARDDQIKMKEQGLAEIKSDRDRIEAEMDGAIDSANTVIATLNEKDEQKAKKIDDLEKQVESAENKHSQVQSLRKIIGLWEERFSLAQDAIVEKDAIIFSLKKKLSAEKKLRLAVEVVRNDYKDSLQTHKELISELTKKLRPRSRWQTMERLAFDGVAGLLLYGAIT